MSQQFPNKVSIPCIFHRNNNCTHICMDSECNNHPYLCSLCITDTTQLHLHHQYNISLLEDGVAHITRSLQSCKTEFEKALSSSCKKYKEAELDNLIHKLTSSVDELKSKVDAVVERLVQEFRASIQNVRESLFQEFDRYQRVRIGTIETYKDSLAHFQKFSKLKFYANSSTFFLKMKTEWNKKSIDWIQNMKKYIGKSEEILLEQPSFISTLNKSIEEMAIEQIGYVDDDLPKQALRSLEDLASSVMKQMVFIRSKTQTFPRKKYRVH